MRKTVNITVKSAVCDLLLAEKYKSEVRGEHFTAEDGNSYHVKELYKVCTESSEYSLLADFYQEGDECRIEYKENTEFGYDNCITDLVFSKDRPRAITMSRSGSISTVMHFDPSSPSQICCYNTPVMPLEFALNTKSVDNNVDENGGVMQIDYVIEVRGIETERIKLNVEVLSYDFLGV